MFSLKDDLETDFASCSVTLSKTTEALQTKLQNMKRTNDGVNACKLLTIILLIIRTVC